MPRKTDTRERLLQAAITTIESKGEHGLRVGDVADAVGVTKPSVYHFFGDREGLVTEALAEMYRRRVGLTSDFLMSLIERANTVEEFVEAMRTAISSVGNEDGVQRRAHVTHVLGAAVTRPALQEALKDVHREIAQRNARFAEIGRAKGLIRLDFDERLTGLLASALFTDRHYVDIDDEFDAAEWDALILEVLRHLLFDGVDRS